MWRYTCVAMATISMVAGAGGVAVMECGVDKHLVVYYVSDFPMTT